MSKMNEDAYENKRALPNKMLNEDGSVTDLFGNPVVPTNEAYKKRSALPNKWLNADGTYSTLQEILGGAIDTDIFIVVEELPQTGEENKIYLVPDGEGGFNEYHYIDGKWDPVGTIDMGISPQVFYWDGTNSPDAIALWNQIYQISRENDVIVISFKSVNDLGVPIIYPIKKQMDLTQNIRGIANARKNIGASESSLYIPYYRVCCIINNNEVTNVITNKSEEQTSLLETSFNYSTPYTPQYSGSPATKKYVDDKVVPQVFYWDGETNQNGINFWNNVRDINKESPVVVFYIEKQSNRRDLMYSAYIAPNSIINNYKALFDPTYPKQDATYPCFTLVFRYYTATFTIVNDEITSVNMGTASLEGHFLDTISTGATGNIYVPTRDNHPANKKYVDDSIASAITNAIGGEY